MTEFDAADLRWLDTAARFATAALGTVGAGPTVGALVVDEARQQLLGRGVTPPRAAGQAELVALAEARGLTEGRTLYVTLEPSAHFTTFAPVTGAIIDAGITRVVAGSLDPEAERAGEGLRDLAEGGIDALYLPHEASDRLNEGYATRIGKGRPFVTLKLTLSPDGMVGHAEPGQGYPLGVESLRFVERERAAADAVLAGAARAAVESNDLCVHLEGLDDRGALRVLMAGEQDLDATQDFFDRVSGVPILVVTTPDRPVALRRGIEVLEVDGRHGHPDLRWVLKALAERGVNRLFVEAGARLAESFIAGELVDRLHVIDVVTEIGPAGVPAATLGSFADRIAAARFSQVDQRVLGEDKLRTFVRL